MSLADLIQWATLIQSVTTIIAICVGGIWAYYRYRRKKEHVWNVNLSPSVQVIHVDAGRMLLNLVIDISNVGSSPFVPGPLGFQITIRHVSLPDIGPVEWKDGRHVLGPIDILANYKRPGAIDYRGEYRLDAGAAYCERFSFVLKPEAFHLIQLRLHEQGEEQYITDYLLVDTRPHRERPLSAL